MSYDFHVHACVDAIRTREISERLLSPHNKICREIYAHNSSRCKADFSFVRNLNHKYGIRWLALKFSMRVGQFFYVLIETLCKSWYNIFYI